jgi:periplasmic divalent cation tolerance protein
MLRTISTVSTTVGTLEQAQNMARQIVKSSVAACVQIDGPLQSFYVWDGKLCDEKEYRLTCKTLPGQVDALSSLVKELHPYQIPELLVSHADCSPDYFQWLTEQVNSESA